MKKTDKTNYVFVAKMIFTAILVLVSIILAIMEYYAMAIEMVIVGIVVWILFTIQEIKIGLLQEINDKLQNKHS